MHILVDVYKHRPIQINSWNEYEFEEEADTLQQSGSLV